MTKLILPKPDLKLKPMLLKGLVMHKRTLPKVNKFQYQALYFYLPLFLKEKLKSKIFSFNKFNIFSFFDQDHNLQELSSSIKSDCLSQILAIFKTYQIDNIKEIILVSQPRIFGYAFNPASFWLGFDYNQNLISALVEVSNTFGQKHSYLLFNQNLKPIDSKQWLCAKKEFHVSPFFKKDGEYKFRFEIKENQLNFYINYYLCNQLQLVTFLKCKYHNLSDFNLILELIKMPFLMFKTIFLIHLQALKLWFFKGVKYFFLPKQSAIKLTTSKNVKK